MTIELAEKKYGIEIVDRTHYDKEEQNYWLNLKCNVLEEKDRYNIEYWSKDGITGECEVFR